MTAPVVLAPLAVIFNAVAGFLAGHPALLAWVAFAAVLALVGWWTTPPVSNEQGGEKP